MTLESKTTGIAGGLEEAPLKGVIHLQLMLRENAIIPHVKSRQ
jgi:hypothetical protein